MSQIQEFRKVAKRGQRAARRQYAAVRLEALEERRLMSAVVGTTGIKSLSNDGLRVLGAAYDSSGTLYLSLVDVAADTNGIQIDRVGAGNTLVPVVSTSDSTEYDSLVAGSGGKLYFIDQAANSIIKYDPSAVNPVSTLFASTPNGAQQIIGLTVSGGDVWFFTNSISDGSDFGHTNFVGRVDPAGNMTPLSLTGDAVLQYTDISSLSAVHLNDVNADAVYIGFKGVDSTANNVGVGAPIGRSAVGVAYVSGPSMVFSYANLPLDAGQYQYSELTGIATDPGDGSVWFALGGGVASEKPVHPANAIAHGTLNAARNGFVTGSLVSYTVKDAVAGNDLRVQSLAFDGAGDLYFTEFGGTKVGMLDTNLVGTDPVGAFSDAALANDMTIEPTSAPLVVAVNPALPASPSDVAATVVALNGYTWLSVAATITPPAEVEFSGSAGLPTAVNEDTQFTHIPIAAFTAPTGNYVAIIHWGDGTPDVTVPVTLEATNVYSVYVDKKFAKQSPAGGFVGSVTIHETGNAQPDHVLSMTNVVNDTPLLITQFSITTLLQRISTLTMTFTDDVDSKLNNFNVNINWGDGSSSQGAILKDPFTAGRYFVLAIHVYKKKGTYNVTATVTGNEEGLLETATQTKTLVLT